MQDNLSKLAVGDLVSVHAGPQIGRTGYITEIYRDLQANLLRCMIKRADNKGFFQTRLEYVTLVEHRPA